MSVSARCVANRFLELARERKKLLTILHVQKMCYIAHGYALAITDTPLYSDDTVAWRHGPVIEDLYYELKKHRKGEDGKVEGTLGVENEEEFSDSQRRIIEAVWEHYKDYSAWQLSELTHRKGTPWHKTWKKSHYGIIPNELIDEHYKEILARAMA